VVLALDWDGSERLVSIERLLGVEGAAIEADVVEEPGLAAVAV
jgi:hypothetical protein